MVAASTATTTTTTRKSPQSIGGERRRGACSERQVVGRKPPSNRRASRCFFHALDGGPRRRDLDATNKVAALVTQWRSRMAVKCTHVDAIRVVVVVVVGINGTKRTRGKRQLCCCCRCSPVVAAPMNSRQNHSAEVAVAILMQTADERN